MKKLASECVVRCAGFCAVCTFPAQRATHPDALT